MRDRQMVPEDRRGKSGQDSRDGRDGRDRRHAAMTRTLNAVGLAILLAAALVRAQAGTVIVVETTRGAFAFETYPNEAPKTSAHVVQLVRQGFYDGQRVHRALPGFVVQWGDPQSRDTSKEADWGRGDAASSGTPIGVSEISKKRLHIKGAVAMAH